MLVQIVCKRQTTFRVAANLVIFFFYQRKNSYVLNHKKIYLMPMALNISFEIYQSSL